MNFCKSIIIFIQIYLPVSSDVLSGGSLIIAKSSPGFILDFRVFTLYSFVFTNLSWVSSSG